PRAHSRAVYPRPAQFRRSRPIRVRLAPPQEADLKLIVPEPAAEPGVDRAPGREAMRQKPPLAAGAEHVEGADEDFAQIRRGPRRRTAAASPERWENIEYGQQNWGPSPRPG